MLLRAMLWLADIEREREAQATLETAARSFEFDCEKITPIMNLKQQHGQPQADQVESIFENMYQVIDHLSRKVDQIEAKA